MIAKNLRKTLTLILCFVFVHYSPQTLSRAPGSNVRGAAFLVRQVVHTRARRS